MSQTLVSTAALSMRQFAYGVHKDFQDIAHTRLAQLEEKTALDCENAGSGEITWYRRSLQTTKAELGEEEQIYDTLLVDWKWTPSEGPGLVKLSTCCAE